MSENENKNINNQEQPSPKVYTEPEIFDFDAAYRRSAQNVKQKNAEKMTAQPTVNTVKKQPSGAS